MPNAWAAAAEFSSVEFHENVLLPFYDHYLKGKQTDYLARPNVEYAVRGSNLVRKADSWPPPGIRYTRWFLNASPSGSVSSLNDGGLSSQPASGAASTAYKYPNPGWVSGVVGFGPAGPPGGFDPARRVLTFTTAPLESDMEICGPIKLILYASSTARDTDFFIKLTDQFPQSSDDRGKGLNPFAELITRGWLRASHRALDPARSTDMVPYHSHVRTAAPDAERDLQIRDQSRADGLPHQARPSSPARDRQRRFTGNRNPVVALLPARQDRKRHDPSRCGASVGIDPAGVALADLIWRTRFS